MMKKEEVEQLITNTVTTPMNKITQNINDKVEQLVSEKLVEMQAKLDSLDYDNKNLKDKIQILEDKTNTNDKSKHEQIDITYELNKLAHMKANYNEQYTTGSIYTQT
ncbi:hypothetical protein DPMN_130264 [Dreissena polymorpha]|uniref:Uncharacterized protein n=1 Tax=Dreissena polymorpha TaxID=45954 RepID=A0A9D4H4D9_DREPO|nr:hypothetical protein DPMN_130264 [Dreissena polymorpha]